MPNASGQGPKSMKSLVNHVINAGLCTHCGACTNLCPYFFSYHDRTVLIHQCDKTEGACYDVCPRTPTNLGLLWDLLFDREDLTPELGAVKGFYVTRSRDVGVRANAQHGGTVTTLVKVALEEGIIDTVLLTREAEALLPASVTITNAQKVEQFAKTKFIVSPNVSAFNALAKNHSGKIGVVATPCQALALAKMRTSQNLRVKENVEKLHLVIGLFCGWAFHWEPLIKKLQTKYDLGSIFAMDIPPSKYHCLNLWTNEGKVSVPLDVMQECIREACLYCCDLTCEFSDISVGSARLPEGWEEAKSWNHVITRSKVGEHLVELCRTKGLLEFRGVPEGNLEKLKKASLKKKKTGIRNLIAKSGDPENLLYLDPGDSALRSVI
jgi:coenzyme F420 hydrogenase subunit beta